MGAIGPLAGLSHYWPVPTLKSTSLRFAAPLLVVCLLGLVAAPATAAPNAFSRSAAPAASAASAVRGHDNLSLQGDTAPQGAARTRRASSAWNGRKILYTETIPVKWDWSLSTAIAKWNSSGGDIRFVRTTDVRKARLNIAYGNIGGAAGMASVGRSRHAWVRLSSSYSATDALDAHNRIEVMAIFTHELGHVLGFQHTSTRCSLMSPVLDVDGCSMVPAAMPGYYKCRIIDAALASRFVRLYGGRVRYPSVWCLIDPLPSAASRIVLTGGPAAPLTVRWSKPAYVPTGSQMTISSWASSTCGPVPNSADVAFASVSAGLWRDTAGEPSGNSCVSVQLVNRYGAGRAAVSRLMRF